MSDIPFPFGARYMGKMQTTFLIISGAVAGGVMIAAAFLFSISSLMKSDKTATGYSLTAIAGALLPLLYVVATILIARAAG